MIGSNGPRMLAATLPHVDAWNTWYKDYGNSPDGFAKLNERITGAAHEAARTGDIERSACVLIALDGSSERTSTRGCAAGDRTADRIASVLL